MPARFYLPQASASGRGELSDEEAGHLARVLRLGVGAEVEVFDGRGRMHRARVVEVGRGRVVVQHLDEVVPAPEPAVRITLGMSVVKGDKMDDVVRDAAMMGVWAVQPLVAARSEVSLATIQRGSRVERWQRIAVSAVKQCGRAVVPTVWPPLEIDTWLARPASDALLVFAEPGTERGEPLRHVTRASAARLVIGPEGGWSAEECAAFAAHGARFVSLGGRTLRADAAPLVAMAALFEAWSGW